MAIPEEDLGPRWLRDYGTIEADIRRMEEFAAKLRAEVIGSYVPHRDRVADDMITMAPNPHAGFAELVGFLQTDELARTNMINAVWFHGDETNGFAEAATKISSNYGASDAFAHARVSEVEQALDSTTTVLPSGEATPPSNTAAGGPTVPSTSPVEH